MTRNTKGNRDIYGRFIKGHKLSKKSKEKIGRANMGHIPWNKGLHINLNPEGGFKKGQAKPKNAYTFPEGLKHPNWKGDNAGKEAMHLWVHRHKGNPSQCSICGMVGNNYQIHWANIDHTYKRNLDDYIALCVSCHKKYDLKNKLYT